MIVLAVMTDGRRECIEQTIPSLDLLAGPITTRMIHDDSGDAEYRRWLRRTFPDWQLVETPGRSGFDGAYRSVRGWLARETTEPFIFSTEDDFVINGPVDLRAMMTVLDANAHVVQLVLKRQAWNESERAAGGIIEQHPDDYEQCDGWVEHRRFWSTNPSLFRRDNLTHQWPKGAHSEGRFTYQLLADPDVRFAFWGHRDDPPRVEHIGHQRVGTGY